MTRTETYTYLCTSSKCPQGRPHWKGFGKKTNRKCSKCGKPLIRITGEPRGTYHPLRS